MLVEPRLYTPPLRELNHETSNGDAFILFCKAYLGVELFPWEKWLAKHILELNTDGSYRFRRVLVGMGRQNGKTLMAACVTAWWLFVDALNEPGKHPAEFVISGEAQNLDTAAVPYEWLVARCNPKPQNEAEAALVRPELAAATARVVRANGKDRIIAKSGASYRLKAAGATRGTPAARVLMDEIREQHTWDAWAASSQTTKASQRDMLLAISSAGTARSVVLNHLRAEGVAQVELAEKHGAGYVNAEGADPSFGFFEWSAPEDAKPLDEAAIIAANPSIGYNGLTVEKCRADYRAMPEHQYRAEVLNQYVPARTMPYVSPRDFEACVVQEGSYRVAAGARTVWAVDTSADRRWTSIAAAVMCEDGVPLVALVREPRLGNLWVPDEVKLLADEAGWSEVMLQERGCPAMEFIRPLTDNGLTVRPVAGSWFGIATGRFRDAVRDKRVRFVRQEPLELAVSAGVTRRFGENDAWDRRGSAVDIAPLVACTLALYGLEVETDVQLPVSAYETRGLAVL